MTKRRRATPVEKIILVGPIAEPGKAAAGGYESANLRLLQLLQNLVPGSTALAYPRVAGSGVRKAIHYAFGFCRIALNISFQSARRRAIHLTPHCRHFLFAELVLASLVRARGYLLVVDLRSGVQQTAYESSSPLYRLMYRRLLRLADVVTYEGDAYRSWVHGLVPRTPADLLPNFVPADLVRRRADELLPAAPRLIYVGAISREKGVEQALRAQRKLQETLPGSRMTLVGRDNQGILDELAGLLSPDVCFMGEVPFDAILRALDDSHFFIFPTSWFGEGHSNALTEAMARGCVPIASDHGFNRSVIGEPALITRVGALPEEMAKVIETLWRSGDWKRFSDAAVRRVAENFTDRQVRRRLQTMYGLKPSAPALPGQTPAGTSPD